MGIRSSQLHLTYQSQRLHFCDRQRSSSLTGYFWRTKNSRRFFALSSINSDLAGGVKLHRSFVLIRSVITLSLVQAAKLSNLTSGLILLMSFHKVRHVIFLRKLAAGSIGGLLCRRFPKFLKKKYLQVVYRGSYFLQISCVFWYASGQDTWA